MIGLAVLDSPVGPLTVAAHGDRVCAVWFGPRTEAEAAIARWYPGAPIIASADPAGAATAFDRYFGGRVDALEEIPVEMHGTPFQRRVWSELRTVRPGATASYRDIARAIGAPAAVRAVGAANGANPVALIVPCHRIVGSKGHLTGYGGGLDRKRWLLDHEASRLF